MQSSAMNQPVTIIRCKQCIHRNSRLERDGQILVNCVKMGDHDFCSYGEPHPSMKVTSKQKKG